MRFDTIAIRGGYGMQEALANAGSICEPAYLSPAQHFESAEDMRRCLVGETPGWVYSRLDNPTVRQLETAIAALESYGADFAATATVFSSGMAAVFMAATALAAEDPALPKPNIVLPAACYGGSYVLFRERFEKDRGIELRWIRNPLDMAEWESAIDGNTRFAFCENPSNPLLQIADIAALARIAEDRQIPLMVDATLASPALMRPLTMGADIVVHSVSKSMSASGLSLAGAVISRPDIRCRHRRTEMRENFAAFLKRGPQRDCGAILSPFNALQSLADLRSLRSRTQIMSQSALQIAQFLSDHPAVSETLYPGLSSMPGHPIAKRDMVLVDSEYDPPGRQNCYGYLLSVRMRGGAEAACTFLDGLEIFWRANDLGRVKSTATIPAIATHSQLSQEEKNASGIPGDLVRLSVGCEHLDDLLDDLARALDRAQRLAA